MSAQPFDLVSADDAVLVKFSLADSQLRRSAGLEELLHGQQLTGRNVVALEEEIHRRARVQAARFGYGTPVEALSR